MKYFCVYKIINLVNNKIYIGKTSHNLLKRFNAHKTAARKKNPKDYSKIHRALNKYGFENFRIEQMEKFDLESDCKEAEIKYIAMYKSRNNDIGYNITKGGDGNSGYIPSEETRKNIVKRLTGTFHSESTKQKMREARIGLERYNAKTYIFPILINDIEFKALINAKTNETFTKIECLSSFSKLYRLNHGHLSQVLNGKRMSHKKWRLIK